MDERHCTCKYIFFGTLQGSNQYQDLIHLFTFFEQLGDLNPSLGKRDHQKGKLS